MKIFLALFLCVFCLQTFAGDRVLVVVIDLAEQASSYRHFYKMETHTALKKINRITKGHYDQVIVHNRKEATRFNFIKTLMTLLADSSVTTIDTIIYLHGKNEQYENGPSICFVGETPCVAAKDISAQIAIHPEAHAKLRALYSDACWGKLHMQSWLNAGYKVANGSSGVDANQSVDLGRFLRKWVTGTSFGEATAHANKALITRFTDWIIKDANSVKSILGDRDISITDN